MVNKTELVCEINSKFDEMCEGIICSKCEYYSNTCKTECRTAFTLDYLEKKEMIVAPPVDWTKVEIDTPIVVGTREEVPRYVRHFAGVRTDGKVLAWNDGKTSITAKGNSPWDTAKLYDKQKHKDLAR